MFSKGLLCDQNGAGYWGCNYKQDIKELPPLWILHFSSKDSLGLLFQKNPKLP